MGLWGVEPPKGVGLGALAPAAGGEPWNVVGAAAHLVAGLGAAWLAFGADPPQTDDLALYLPALAFGAGLARFAWMKFQAASLTFQAGIDAAARLETYNVKLATRLWVLTAGAALLLNQYPRMDEIHLLWSGGVLFVAGADVLHAWYRHLVRLVPALGRTASGRLALGASLALLPVVAAVPLVWYRLDGLAALVPAAPGETHAATAGAQAEIAPVALPAGAGTIWLPAANARDVEEVVSLLLAQTAPGEAIFAYPSIPGFYYLADRPNATRFNHLFPGFASPAEQEEMVRQLAGVRYVVWDDGAAHYWVKPGDNAPVTEYIRTHFRVERFIGPYAVLARNAQGPALNYPLPNPTPG